jgi:hypothetical protein
MEDARSRQFDERAIELDKPRYTPKYELGASPEDITKHEKLVAELKAELKKLQVKEHGTKSLL